MSAEAVPSSRRLRTAGALVTGVFALPWALTGASSLGSPGTARAAMVAAAVLTGLAVVSALWPDRGAAARRRRVPPDWQRRFNRIGAVQSAIIPALVVALVVNGQPPLVPAAVCLVVGLHFLPLARVFDQPQFAWTGTALCVVAVAGAALLLAGHPGGAVGLVGVGAAAVLWTTSLHVSRRDRPATGRGRTGGAAEGQVPARSGAV